MWVHVKNSADSNWVPPILPALQTGRKGKCRRVGGDPARFVPIRAFIPLIALIMVSTHNGYLLNECWLGFILFCFCWRCLTKHRRLYLKLPRDSSTFFKPTLLGEMAREGQIAFRPPSHEKAQPSPCLQLRHLRSSVGPLKPYFWPLLWRQTSVI
jgi:hypothetical protein